MPQGSSLKIWNFVFACPIESDKLKPVDFQVPVGQLIFLEIFSGTAQLSACAKDVGFLIYPVDHHKHRAAKASIVPLDLTQPAAQNNLISMLCSANIGAAHIASPCGARPFEDQPFRSPEQPLGVEHLSGSNAAMVARANRLYAFVLFMTIILLARNCIVSQESTPHAPMWLVIEHYLLLHPALRPWWDRLEDNLFQNCLWGSATDHWTNWRGTLGLFTALRRTSALTQEHLSSHDQPALQVNASSGYPKPLCSAYVDCVCQALQARGVQFPPSHLEHVSTARALRDFSAKHEPPLLSEYWLITTETRAQYFFSSKPLATPVASVKMGQVLEDINDSEPSKAAQLEQEFAGQPSTALWLSGAHEGETRYGVHRTPDQAIQAALRIKHPLDYKFPLPDLLVTAVVKVISMGPEAIVRHRASVLKQMLVRRQELSCKEKQLHLELHPEIRPILAGKQLLLWKEVLQDTNFPDENLIDEVIQGFQITGQAPFSPVFPHGHQPSLQSEEELMSQAKWRRKATIAKCLPSSDDADVDRELWEQTLTECSRGWLQGPFESEQEVTNVLGHDSWICTRRFPLRQKEKIRIIDDGLESGLNSAFGAYNKLKLMDVDVLASLIALVMNCCAASDQFVVHLDSGQLLKGTLHPGWGADLGLVGRALDLKHAYKQLAANPSKTFNRVLVAWSTDSSAPRFFLSTALMFGSASSVYSFNRCAASLWHVLLCKGYVWATFFYDDFPNVELKRAAKSARDFSESILKMLGWEYAESGRKALDYSPIFNVLGVTIDLSESSHGLVRIANKEERVEALLHTLSQMLDKQKISAGEAASLHGQLNFCQGQLFGCALKPALAFLSGIAQQGWSKSLLPQLAAFAIFVASTLKQTPPRVIRVAASAVPVVCFTD